MSRRTFDIRGWGLAAALLQACSGGDLPGPDSAPGNALVGLADSFRYEGVLLGADGLDERYGGNGVNISAALEDPDDLPLFLAASHPVTACDGSLPAVIYASPLHRTLLVTRWSTREGLQLASVHAIPAPPSDPESMTGHWLDALPEAANASAVLEARFDEALRRARDETLCARTRERSTEPTPLIADVERDADLLRVADPAERLGEVHRALERLVAREEEEPLRALGFAPFMEALVRLPTAEPAVLPVPVSALDAGPTTLILYADLNVSGRYILLGQIERTLDGPEVAPAGVLELIALPVPL